MHWADAKKLPFEANHFGTVLSISVLEHIPEVENVFPEIFRVLKPGGKLIFTVPTKDINQNLLLAQILTRLGLVSFAKKYVCQYHTIFKHVNIFSQHQWQKLALNAGFDYLYTKPTMSPKHLQIFETFLITAFPSQLFRWVTSQRKVGFNSIRLKLLPLLFKPVLKPPLTTGVNIMIVCQKPAH